MPKFEKKPQYDDSGKIIGYKYLIDNTEQSKEIYDNLYEDPSIKKENIQPIGFNEFRFNIPEQDTDDINDDEDFDDLYRLVNIIKTANIDEGIEILEQNIDMVATSSFLRGQAFAFKQAKSTMAQAYRDSYGVLDEYLTENDIEDDE